MASPTSSPVDSRRRSLRTLRATPSRLAECGHDQMHVDPSADRDLKCDICWTNRETLIMRLLEPFERALRGVGPEGEIDPEEVARMEREDAQRAKEREDRRRAQEEARKRKEEEVRRKRERMRAMQEERRGKGGKFEKKKPKTEQSASPTKTEGDGDQQMELSGSSFSSNPSEVGDYNIFSDGSSGCDADIVMMDNLEQMDASMDSNISTKQEVDSPGGTSSAAPGDKLETGDAKTVSVSVGSALLSPRTSPALSSTASEMAQIHPVQGSISAQDDVAPAESRPSRRRSTSTSSLRSRSVSKSSFKKHKRDTSGSKARRPSTASSTSPVQAKMDSLDLNVGPAVQSVPAPSNTTSERSQASEQLPKKMYQSTIIRFCRRSEVSSTPNSGSSSPTAISVPDVATPPTSSTMATEREKKREREARRSLRGGEKKRVMPRDEDPNRRKSTRSAVAVGRVNYCESSDDEDLDT